MLKIKDNVDLKELEKFGFTFENKENSQFYFNQFDLYFKQYSKGIAGYYDIILCKDRKIDDRVDAETFYQLIKADLVEEVSNE